MRVLRCVFRDERRSAVFAASSVDEAMCDEVMSHCSTSVFSLPLYYCALGESRSCALGATASLIGSTYLCFGEHGRRKLDHVGFSLNGIRERLLDQRSGPVVETRHVADGP